MPNDNHEYMRVYILNRYHQRRQEAIAFLGGVCVVCYTDEGLQIDHIDPKTKTMNISKLWSVSEERYWAEINLCQILCEPHHIEKSRREARDKVVHGKTHAWQKLGCTCDTCMSGKREYLDK